MKKLYDEQHVQNIAEAIRNKSGSTDTYKISEMANAIENLPSGGGNFTSLYADKNGYYNPQDEGYDGYDWVTVDVPPPSADPEVAFYNPRGELIFGYTAEEFLALDEMPEMDDNYYYFEYSEFDGWNWDLATAKQHIRDYGKLDIGALYKTFYDVTAINVEINEGKTNIKTCVCVNGTVTIDWGDGETTTLNGTSTSVKLYAEHNYDGYYSTTITYKCIGKMAFGYVTNASLIFMPQNAEVGVLADNLMANYVKSFVDIIRGFQFASNCEPNNYLLMDCCKLEFVTFPKNYTATFINTNCFYRTYNLRFIAFPPSITQIGQGAMTSSGIKNVSFPQALSVTNTNVFNGCRNLKRVFMPTTARITTTSNSSIFQNCTALEEATISKNTTVLPASLFQGCVNLKKFTIPDNATNIQSAVFSGCSNLEEVNFRSGLYNFQSATQMFKDCVNLKRFYCSNGASTFVRIPQYMFQNCYSLEDVTMPNTVTTANSYAFQNCYNLKKVLNSWDYETLAIDFTSPTYVFSNCFTLLDVKIKDTSTQLNQYAISICPSIKYLKIPASVMRLADYSLIGLYGCEEIDFSDHTSIPTLSGTQVFGFQNGTVFTKIVVPENLYADWKTTTNWNNSAIVSHIYYRNSNGDLVQ